MPRQFKKLSHSIYECKYHIVFCPKYRYRILKGEVGEYVRQQIYHLSHRKDLVEVLELNVQPDHVHLVTSIPPKYAISNFMGYLKGKLAIRLFNRYEKLGRRYWGRHLWARGYCVSTVGLDEEKIRKYVKWQEKKEKATEATQRHGLLQNSFRPEEEMVALRSLVRQREMIIRYRSAHIQHIQKALQQMNVKLDRVVTDVTGKTGMTIIRAIISGERDETRLAAYRDGRCRHSEEEIAQALVGNYRQEHLFALQQARNLSIDLRHFLLRNW